MDNMDYYEGLTIYLKTSQLPLKYIKKNVSVKIILRSYISDMSPYTISVPTLRTCPMLATPETLSRAGMMVGK